MDVAILAPAAAMHRVPRSVIRPAPKLGRGVVAIAHQHGQEVQLGGRAGVAETTRAGLNENSAFCRLGVRCVPDTQPFGSLSLISHLGEKRAQLPRA